MSDKLRAAKEDIIMSFRCRVLELDSGCTITIMPGSLLHEGMKRQLKKLDGAEVGRDEFRDLCKVVLDGYDNPDRDGDFDWPNVAERLRAALKKRNKP